MQVRQRHKKHQKDMEKGRGSIDSKMFADDEELLGQPEPEKPTPPPEFSETRIKQEIEKKAKEFRRHPGLEFQRKVSTEVDFVISR